MCPILNATTIQFKDGTVKTGEVLNCRPDLGDISLILKQCPDSRLEEIFFRDMESCQVSFPEGSINLLEMICKQGYDSELDVNFKGEAKIAFIDGKKLLTSRNYNYLMDMKDGFFRRWGRGVIDDPKMSVFGPEIADIEISTICHGIHGKPCPWCYKSNTGKGQDMSLGTFQTIFSKFPETLTQIAFGIGDLDANPDMWKIFEHCRENRVIPNVTINGDRASSEDFDKLVELCGAVAVSRYSPKDVCYDAVQELSTRGLTQTNIHMLLAKETYEDCLELIEDAKSDARLRDLNAIVFLALKERGRGVSMHSLRNLEQYKALVEKAFEEKVSIGFDSCSASLFLKSVQGHPNYEQFYEMSEPCESTLFSIYVDVEGNVWPCSFLENEEYEPINLLEVNDFLKQCWHSDKLNKFRKDLFDTVKCKSCLVEGVRECPKYELYLDF